jgi:hypothetical protein
VLGGGAKRFAHLAVIEVFEAQSIHPDIVVGTSVCAPSSPAGRARCARGPPPDSILV